MERAFNEAAGLTKAHDRMPEFMKYEPLPPHNVVWDVLRRGAGLRPRRVRGQSGYRAIRCVGAGPQDPPPSLHGGFPMAGADIQLSLRAYAGLRHYLPGVPLGGSRVVHLPPGSTVGRLLELAGIPGDQVKTCFVNGIHAELGRVLEAGDEVAVFPPVGGG